MDTKLCMGCWKRKNVNRFGWARKTKSRPRRRHALCNLCTTNCAVEWLDNNPEEVRKYIRRYLKLISAKRIREEIRAYKASNPDAVVKRKRKRYDEKIYYTPQKRLHRNVSNMLNKALKGEKNGISWTAITGYNVDSLRKHLEQRFSPKMSWDNYGNYWHIDHIIPVSAFNFTLPRDIDVRRCWALENLQPLEAVANMKKGDKISAPFQPSLLLAV